MPYNSFCGVVWCVWWLPRMFIYPTDLKRHTEQYNQFLYIYGGIFTPIYTYVLIHIHNKQYISTDFLFVYTYIFTYVHPFLYVYTYVYYSIYIFVFHMILWLTAQVVLNAFSIGCHTLHTRPSYGLHFVMHPCVLINRRNSIYLYRMFSIWLHTIVFH